jgi:rare lipoprotein A
MEPRPGNERNASTSGRARTAFTLAAMVVLSAFATDNVTPAAAQAETALVMSNVSPAEIINVVTAPKTPLLKRIKSGFASWYGEMWQGRQTASGRIFDMNEMTAAHKTLPFGSKVKVTDLRNHRSVIVTITDRGALFPGRVIDLSLGAARQLRMVSAGIDPVRLELLTYQN